MLQTQPQWHVSPLQQVPHWFGEAVKAYVPTLDGRYAAQLLWQRGMREPEKLAGFLNWECYQPVSPFEFGQEMKWAIARLKQAREAGEKVAIWGDFDADGITSTSILWEGLGQFLPQHQLSYTIPNRLTDSHGLNNRGIEKLAAAETKLIVTCDTGSTNLSEIDYAQQLGIDIIVTDHHTLPEERPPVISIINPRYFAETHPLYHLSGVAVAYKLVEAMYLAFPQIPRQPLEELLDLVAIGLIADLVQLSGDCRYLAQRGIAQLQKQGSPLTATRPGVARLLELCKRSGDRPTDISFGIGPRINAVSRIQGDASFCVELLTSRDRQRCSQLAHDTELANTRRKSLQKDVTAQVKKKLAQMDLSTTSVIVLEDLQWQGGVLGLVAGQIAQEYGRPTVLLSTAQEDSPTPLLARGSARSVNNIDLYELVHSQAHLLHRFGGHPFAAGLSLPVENLPLFRESINQQLRQKSLDIGTPMVEADLVVSVSELGQELFRELKLLEPCGMGNPVPKLLIQNCWFEDTWNENIKDRIGNKVKYLKTTFKICDRSDPEGFPGIWWGYSKDDLPKATCDAIVELDYNTFKEGRYEVRLIALRASAPNGLNSSFNADSVLDWRGEAVPQNSNFRVLQECPTSWDDLQKRYRQAIANQQKLALAYSPPSQSPQSVWQQLVGIAKYLSRTGSSATKEQFQQKLELSDRTLNLGFEALAALGFKQGTNESIQIIHSQTISPQAEQVISSFLAAVEEEQFQRQYFSQIPLATVQGILAQAVFHSASNVPPE